MSALNTISLYQQPQDSEALKGLHYYAGTLTGNVTLDYTYPSTVKLDPGGASRDVTLEAVTNRNLFYRRIINSADAAENLVVKNAGGSTIGTINQNEQGEFHCDGSAWSLIAITTIALS